MIKCSFNNILNLKNLILTNLEKMQENEMTQVSGQTHTRGSFSFLIIINDVFKV